MTQNLNLTGSNEIIENVYITNSFIFLSRLWVKRTKIVGIIIILNDLIKTNSKKSQMLKKSPWPLMICRVTICFWNVKNPVTFSNHAKLHNSMIQYISPSNKTNCQVKHSCYKIKTSNLNHYRYLNNSLAIKYIIGSADINKPCVASLDLYSAPSTVEIQLFRWVILSLILSLTSQLKF